MVLDLAKKSLVEFIGTMFLVLSVGFMCVSPAAGGIPPIAIGATLMIMVFAGGHISGGHYNPAVSMAAMLRGALPVRDYPVYVLAQVLGACAAASCVGFEKGFAPDSPPPHLVAALLAEFLYTFALCYVVLNVATAQGTSGNSFYGLAIGSTVMVGAFSVGSISGGAFNPAVTVGAGIMNLLPVSDIVPYIVVELLAAAVAAAAFLAVNPVVKKAE